MPPESLMNPLVKTAIDALQRGDKAMWNSLFATDAQLFDDGNLRSLRQFSDEAVGHESFIKIERVENDGLDVFGQFHSDEWGDFRTYFKFRLNGVNKIERPDIGQA